MSKPEFEADIGGVGFINTTPAGPRYSLSGTLTAGLKSGVGRRVAMCMAPEDAAKWAWRLLAMVAKHHPELARCTHERWEGHPAAEGRYCATCGAREEYGVRTVYSPAVPIYKGDDVRLSLSYLERMNDVKLREAVEAFLRTVLDRMPTIDKQEAIERMADALKAARTQARTGGVHNVERVPNLAESDKRERTIMRLSGLWADTTDEVHVLNAHVAYTLVCVHKGKPVKYTGVGAAVERRARALRKAGTHNMLVRNEDGKPRWRRLTPVRRVELREPDGLVWTDSGKERAVHTPSGVTYVLASEDTAGAHGGKAWDVFVYEKEGEAVTRVLKVSTGWPTKEKARTLIRADVRKRNAGY